MLVNLRRAPAAVPPNGTSATARTKAVLGDVCRFGQQSVTDASVSRYHCIVFRHVMLLSLVLHLEQHPQAGFRL